MGRLILLLILGFVAAMYFPDSRAMLLEKGEPLLRPVLRWSAIREMEEIARGVQTHENSYRALPARREWIAWIEERYAGNAARDPWGNLYQLEVQEDSFAILSFGPDRVQKTEDDLRQTRVRDWRAKGR